MFKGLLDVKEDEVLYKAYWENLILSQERLLENDLLSVPYYNRHEIRLMFINSLINKMELSAECGRWGEKNGKLDISKGNKLAIRNKFEGENGEVPMHIDLNEFILRATMFYTVGREEMGMSHESIMDDLVLGFDDYLEENRGVSYLDILLAKRDIKGNIKNLPHKSLMDLANKVREEFTKNPEIAYNRKGDNLRLEKEFLRRMELLKDW